MRRFVTMCACVALCVAGAGLCLAQDRPSPDRPNPERAARFENAMREMNGRANELRGAIREAKESGRERVAEEKMRELREVEMQMANARREFGGDRPQPPREGGDRPQPPREGGVRPQPPREGGDRPQPTREGVDRPQPTREGVRPQPSREGGDRPQLTREGVDRPQPTREGVRPQPSRGDIGPDAIRELITTVRTLRAEVETLRKEVETLKRERR